MTCCSVLLFGIASGYRPQPSGSYAGSAVGMNFSSFSANGLNSAGSTWLLTNGAPSFRAVPPRQAADMMRLKSPRNTSGVGTI